MKFRKVALSVTLCCSLVVTPVFAEPSSSDLKAEKSSAQSEVTSLQGQLSGILNQISTLKSEIADTNTKLDETGKELDAAEQKEQEQYEAMKLRIKYMYEEGTSDKTLEKVVEATNITEMLNQVEYVSTVHTYDRQMLDEYAATKKEVAKKQESYQTQIEELTSQQDEVASQQSSLVTLISEKKDEVAQLDSQIASAAQAEAKAAEEAQKAQQEVDQQSEELVAANKANNTSSNSSSNTSSSKPSSSSSNSGSSNSNSSNSSSSKPSSSNSNSSSSSSSSNNSSSSSSSASGSAVVSYACQFVGNKYVYGGTSLTNGIDCSGFTQAVYRHFGYSIPRSSGSQRSAGRAVSYSQAQPGDLICYEGHVAIYMGGGKIVHASNSAPYPKGGIKISSNAQYRTIVAVRRIIN